MWRKSIKRNIVNLRNKVSDGYYDIDIDAEAPYLTDDYVFDKNITIAENRRRIEAENIKIEDKRVELYGKQIKLNNEFIGDLFKFLVDTFGISNEQAISCIEWAFNEAGENDTEIRFKAFIKVVSFLSCFYNKEVYGLDKLE